MAKDINSLAMPFQLSDGQIPAPSETDDALRASLERIIHTRRGERPMRPGVGSRCWDFVYENTGSLTAIRLRTEIRNAISQQEPRVRLISVDAVPFDQLPDNPGLSGFRVAVVYRYAGEVQTMTTDLDAGGSA